MEVRAYRWVGVRTDRFDATVRFFRDVLGLPHIEHDPTATVAAFRLPSGQRFEVFGPASRYYPLHACPVVGFEVDDVRAARAELAAAGVEFASEVVCTPRGEAWVYFRGPDGFLYELTQHPAGPAREPPG
jgi:catechol 2,3-dioxygenase-like lactoylglutathione lyase family enzyme